MTPKPATELPPLMFELVSNQFCCGMLDLGGFAWRMADYYPNGRYNPNPVVVLSPAEEELAAFDRKLREAVWEEVSSNENSNDDGYYYVQCSLIASDPNFAALVEHFKNKKWKLVTEFQNHNTKNTVYAFSKKFKFSSLKRQFGEKEEEEDDWY